MEFSIIAQVYRSSAVHCQVTRYSQGVPGYLTRYSVSANEISFDKKNQPISRTGQPLFAVGLDRAWFVPKDSEKGPQCQHQTFSLMSKASFEWHNQNLQKSWMELVWHIPMRLDTSCIQDFLHSTFDVPVGQWPLKHAQYVREAVWFCGHVSHSWGSR